MMPLPYLMVSNGYKDESVFFRLIIEMRRMPCTHFMVIVEYFEKVVIYLYWSIITIKACSFRFEYTIHNKSMLNWCAGIWTLFIHLFIWHFFYSGKWWVFYESQIFELDTYVIFFLNFKNKMWRIMESSISWFFFLIFPLS